MGRVTLFAAAAVVVLTVSIAAVVLLPGALADRSGDGPPARLGIVETTLSASTVTGETATLGVQTALEHSGGPAENVTVIYRAIDTETGLLETTDSRELGTISEAGEVTASGNLTVEREGGYRIETRLYQDGRRTDGGRTTVSGVGTLKPAYASSLARFHRFEGLGNLRPIQYTVRAVRDERVTVEVASFVTNTGDEPADDLRIVIQARQADSNVVADRGEVTVSGIESGRTVTPSTTLTVPDEYNYFLDALLYRNGVIVDTSQSAANLRPTEVITPNQTRREIGLQVEDFERDRNGGPARQTAAPDTVASSQPGFGLSVTISAIVLGLGAGVARRWSS